jgi:TonB family protein
VAFALIGSPDYLPVKINQTVEASYPLSIEAAGIRSGIASVAISIDADGVMTDYVVTAYTHPAFAERAVAALQRWTFEPARMHGTPCSSKSDLTFQFEIEGVVVVSLNVSSSAEMINLKIRPNSEAYAASLLSQLDRAPNPTKVVNPAYPGELARSSRGGHVDVEFFIDQQGHVRIPSVSRETAEMNQELSAVAVTALSQWQFEPPLLKGRPVLVLAHQEFNFKPASP